MLCGRPRHHLWGDNPQREVLSPGLPFRRKCDEPDHGGSNEGTPKGLVVMFEDEPTKSVQTEKVIEHGGEMNRILCCSKAKHS